MLLKADQKEAAMMRQSMTEYTTERHDPKGRSLSRDPIDDFPIPDFVGGF